MATIDDIRDLGYDVGIAFDSPEFTIYRVEGFGISTQVRGDDDESLAALADKDAHEERVKQHGESQDETFLRWHADKKRDFSLPRDEVTALKKRVRESKEAEAKAAEEDDS